MIWLRTTESLASTRTWSQTAKIEVLGMRYAHLRAEDGTLTQFAKLAACHRITGDESPMDSFQSTTVFNRDSLLKK
jgi:hypothetical protein